MKQAQDLSVVQSNVHKVCNTCKQQNTPQLYLCSKCTSIKYCSSECQSDDYSSHQLFCNEIVKYNKNTR